MNEIFGSDAFSPKEIAEKIQNIGVIKARLPLRQMIILGLLAGAFISLGSLFFVLVISDQSLSFASSRLLGGLVFSLGLILVIIAGAELFTGNNLLVMAWADRKISSYDLLKNWTIVSLSNFLGALGIAFLLYCSQHTLMNEGEIGAQYIRLAQTKCSLTFFEAFISGIFCNIFVCLAVWMSQAGRSVLDKVVVIIFPVTAFVAAGFEHSIANMFLIPMGLFLKNDYPQILSDQITFLEFFKNLMAVVSGNIIGGGGFVALIYYIIYKKSALNK